MTRFLSLSMLLVLFAVATGCDNSNPEGDAPALISPDLFQINTNIFNSTPAAKIESKVNFSNAALRVWPVSLVVSASLILPSAVTAAAVQDEPEFRDGAWRWESTATFNNNSATFGLIAEPEGNGHNWSALISYNDAVSQTQLTDFELFSGRTEQGGTVGSWQLFLPIEGNSTNMLNADFTRDSETKKAITFSIPESGAQNSGDSVLYSEDGDTRRFVWTQVGAGVTHTVVWNQATGVGSITATNFNGGAKSCWNATQDDVECAPGS